MLAIGSWNMALGMKNIGAQRQREQWAHLAELAAAHSIDVLLLQEASRPPDPVPFGISPPQDAQDAWSIRYRSGMDRRFCSAISWFDTSLRIAAVEPETLERALPGEVTVSHLGQFRIAEIQRSQRLTVVSLYGVFDLLQSTNESYADATLHRAISDLLPLLQDRAKEPILIGGDLNIWHKYSGGRWTAQHDSVFDRLSAYGLDVIGPTRSDDEPLLPRCPCRGEDCRHVNTYRHNKQAKNVPYQNDYFIGSAALRDRLVRCYAATEDTSWIRSDHRLIVAEFDI